MYKKNPRSSYNACLSLMKREREWYLRCITTNDYVSRIIAKREHAKYLAHARILRFNSDVGLETLDTILYKNSAS
jgi:hypothetical protein